MNQLNNISTPKGRKVFSRRILFFFFFILAVIALVLGLNLKRYTDRERKQDNIEKEITMEKVKWCMRYPPKVQRYDRGTFTWFWDGNYLGVSFVCTNAGREKETKLLHHICVGGKWIIDTNRTIMGW